MNLLQRPLIFIPVFVSIAIFGCDRKHDPRSAANSDTQSVRGQCVRHIEVQVSSAGDIRVDGTPMSIDQVDAPIAKIANESGSVWYYRQAATGEPHTNVMRVLELVMKYRVPISMSSKPDFSDYIDEKGVSQPRK